MPDEALKLLILGAHPDDAEYHAGGLAAIYREFGHTVKMVSMTNGAAGHHEKTPSEMIPIRRAEAAAAAAVIGAAADVWDIPDGELTPTLEVRWRVIREIRTFRPDLVLAHRPNDYHPDHRAAGQLVQDASYLVTVPGVVRDVPPLHRDPVVAYMPDLFTRPCPLRADVALDVTDRLEAIVRMLACHRSQVFEWLAYEEDILDTVPADDREKLVWLRGWYLRHVGPRVERFEDELVAAYGLQRAGRIEAAEVYELSEYAGKADAEALERLFPGAVVLRAA
jgi:N-acetylglucosamine malate deacetylase 1